MPTFLEYQMCKVLINEEYDEMMFYDLCLLFVYYLCYLLLWHRQSFTFHVASLAVKLESEQC